MKDYHYEDWDSVKDLAQQYMLRVNWTGKDLKTWRENGRPKWHDTPIDQKGDPNYVRPPAGHPPGPNSGGAHANSHAYQRQ